ncbi:MAG: beta-hydroxyacyl-ACP dehydratase [Planctomycetaceae bacterium]|nr:beta-hydroxyacyl-ACP dehydratase [Planctomycetaceae bacterium]
MSLEQIKSLIPHRAPMLLIDEITSLSQSQIVCLKTFAADEFFFQGHYPEQPIVPGVILCEAAMQTGAALLSTIIAGDMTDDGTDKVPVATRLNNVKFKQMVKPGDTIELTVTLTEQVSNAFFLNAKVTVAGKLATRFDFACTLADAS